MEDLKTLFAGRTRLPEAPKTPHTIIFFKPKQLPEHKAMVRGVLEFECKLYFKGSIHFNNDALAILRKYGLKHKHDGAYRVRAVKY